jgi:hypothetical protein
MRREFCCSGGCFTGRILPEKRMLAGVAVIDNRTRRSVDGARHSCLLGRDSDLLKSPRSLAAPRNQAEPLPYENQVLLATDGHGFTRIKQSKGFFFLIRVHPRSSVANKVSLVLAQGSGHRNSMRSGVQRLISTLLQRCRQPPRNAEMSLGAADMSVRPRRLLLTFWTTWRSRRAATPPSRWP